MSHFHLGVERYLHELKRWRASKLKQDLGLATFRNVRRRRLPFADSDAWHFMDNLGERNFRLTSTSTLVIANFCYGEFARSLRQPPEVGCKGGGFPALLLKRVVNS